MRHYTVGLARERSTQQGTLFFEKMILPGVGITFFSSDSQRRAAYRSMRGACERMSGGGKHSQTSTRNISWDSISSYHPWGLQPCGLAVCKKLSTIIV